MTPLSRKVAVCLTLSQGATVELKKFHHSGLPVLEAGGGHGLETVAEGVGVIVDDPEDTEDTEGMEDMEDMEHEGHGGQGGDGGRGGQEEKQH